MEEETRSKSATQVFGDGLAQKKLEQQKQKREEEFDAKLEKLANKAVDMYMKYGEEHYLTQILTTFLDVAIQLREVMETLSAINVAMECLNEAIGFMDDAMNYDNQIMEEWMKEDYGFWSRRKKKKRMRQVINNNVGRMKSMVDGMLLKYQMTQEIIGALQGATGKMTKYMAKNSLKQPKRKKSLPPPPPSAASKMIQELVAKRQGGSDGTKGTPTVPPSAAAPAASAAPSNDVPNIDDIA